MLQYTVNKCIVARESIKNNIEELIFFMHITKQVNGLYKVEYKGLAFPLYVESYDQAIEIVWKLAGVNNGK